MRIFTSFLSSMHSLTRLTLPSFELTLLKHHSAFGLEEITFLNRTFEKGEVENLWKWLDGQVNVRHALLKAMQPVNHTKGCDRRA